MADEPSDDLWGGELGGFEVEIDDSAAVARAQRIAAARQAGKGYQAKVDEPSWFNDPVQASRSKGAARPALFALHQAYYERRFSDVVDQGLELLDAGIKEDIEVLDLVLRAAMRSQRETETRVLALARRWPEFPNLPSHSLVSARVLAASAPIAATRTLHRDCIPCVTLREVISAALASLRLHPTLPGPRAFLRSALEEAHPSLAAALADSSPRVSTTTVEASSGLIDAGPAGPTTSEARSEEDPRIDFEAEVERVDVGEAERDILRRVLGLNGGPGAGEDELEGAGRDVRSL